MPDAVLPEVVLECIHIKLLIVQVTDCGKSTELDHILEHVGPHIGYATHSRRVASVLQKMLNSDMAQRIRASDLIVELGTLA